MSDQPRNRNESSQHPPAPARGGSRLTAVASSLRRNLLQALAKADWEQADLLLERLREEDPLSVETRGLELDYLLRTDRLDEAQELARQLVETFPRSPRIHYLAGRVAYRRRDYAASLTRLRESHSLHPHWRTAWWVAKALTQSGEFSEAATILEPLTPEHHECGLDLAWLYERQEQYDKAHQAIEAFLQHRPDHEFAKAQLVRLRARTMDHQDLVEETQGLMAFGEDISEAMLPEYLEALFQTGKWSDARDFLAQRCSDFSPRLAARAGWVCYRSRAYDLAYGLFVKAFDHQSSNVKFLAALEFAAKRAERTEQLIKLYESHVQQQRRLYGRLQRLRNRLGA